MKIKIILSLIICLTIIPMVFAVPAEKYVYKYEPALLAEGWNGVAIIPYYENLSVGDYNVSLVNKTGTGTLNLLGMSFMTPNGKCKPLSALTFWDADDNSYNYEDAKTNNWIDAIEFTENLETTGCVEEFTKLCPYEAIWIRSYLAVNMTVSNVFGSPHETFEWSDLRFRNSSGDEKTVAEADTADWIFGSGSAAKINYWSTTNNQFETVCVGICDATTLNSWQGYFIYSNVDNLYMLTNNDTKKNVIKVKCNAKYVGADGVCKFPKPKAKYVGADKVFKFRGFSSHIIRLIGSLRKTKG